MFIDHQVFAIISNYDGKIIKAGYNSIELKTINQVNGYRCFLFSDLI